MKSKYTVGDFLVKVGILYNALPTYERVFIHDGQETGDGLGILIGYERGQLVKSTEYGNFQFGGKVRYATENEIRKFVEKIHHVEEIKDR